VTTHALRAALPMPRLIVSLALLPPPPLPLLLLLRQPRMTALLPRSPLSVALSAIRALPCCASPTRPASTLSSPRLSPRSRALTLRRACKRSTPPWRRHASGALLRVVRRHDAGRPHLR
jgi:hypothetical protein